MKNRAESAETLCNSLAEANSKLEEKLNAISNREMEKVSSLAKQLGQSESQLQQAKASIEASQENQNMLYSTLDDMESLIEDQKAKSLKAEDSAESAEAKYILLTETNLELQEKLGFLQGRVECLETSLRQADDMKMAVSEDIGLRAKVISDLVVKLALERERLHTKVDKSAKEAEASLTCETEVGPTASGTESTLGLMRKLVARQLNSKYVFMAVLILLISVAVS